jgi:hypothetical protein
MLLWTIFKKIKKKIKKITVELKKKECIKRGRPFAILPKVFAMKLAREELTRGKIVAFALGLLDKGSFVALLCPDTFRYFFFSVWTLPCLESKRKLTRGSKPGKCANKC